MKKNKIIFKSICFLIIQVFFIGEVGSCMDIIPQQESCLSPEVCLNVNGFQAVFSARLAESIEVLAAKAQTDNYRPKKINALVERLEEIAPSLEPKQIDALKKIADWVGGIYRENGLAENDDIYHNLKHAFEVSRMALEFVQASRQQEGYKDDDILSAVIAGLLRDIARTKALPHPDVQRTINYLEQQTQIKEYLVQADISWLKMKTLILGSAFPFDMAAKSAFRDALKQTVKIKRIDMTKMETLSSIFSTANNFAPYLIRDAVGVTEAVLGLPREIETRMSAVFKGTAGFLAYTAERDEMFKKYIDNLPLEFRNNWARTQRLIKAWSREYRPFPEDTDAAVHTIIKTLLQYVELDNTQLHALYNLFNFIVDIHRQDGLEDYDGYHSLRHTLEVCYLAMQMAVSQQEEKGYSSLEIFSLTIAGFLHDYDNRLRLRGETGYTNPVVMRTIREINKDEQLQDWLITLGLNLAVIKALIWRTDFPYAPTPLRDPQTEFEKHIGLAVKEQQINGERIQDLGQLLAFADKGAGYILKDAVGQREFVWALGRDLPFLAGKEGFLQTKDFLDNELTNKREFLEYAAWLPAQLQENWARTNSIVSTWKVEPKPLPSTAEEAAGLIIELAQESIPQLENEKLNAFKQLLSWTVEHYKRDGLDMNSLAYHNLRQMFEVVYMVLQGAAFKLLTREISSEDLLCLVTAAILQNLDAGDRKEDGVFTHPEVERTLEFIDPQNNPDAAVWFAILNINWLVLKAIIRRTDYPFGTDYADPERRALGKAALLKYEAALNEAMDSLPVEKSEKAIHRNRIDNLGGWLSSVNLSAMYLNRSPEEVKESLIALEKTQAWGDIIEGTYRFLTQTVGNSRHFKDYLAGIPWVFHERWHNIVDLAQQWGETAQRQMEIKEKKSLNREQNNILGILQGLFSNFWDHDAESFRNVFYEKEFYRRNKLLLISGLQEVFAESYLQRFYSDFIEVSVYDKQDQCRNIYRFKREQRGHSYLWRVDGIDAERPAIEIIPGIEKAPLKTVLINLESKHYEGVKGSPEGIKTIQSYVEKFNKKQSHLTVFDNQWPENDSNFFLEQVVLEQPDVVGISATFGSLEELEKLIRALSALDKPPLIIVGSLLASWSYDYLLEKYPQILIVRFEGEEAMSQILDVVYKSDVVDERIPQNYDFSSVGHLVFAQNRKNKNIIIETPLDKKVDLHKAPAPIRDPEELIRMRSAGWLANSEGLGRGCGYSACAICTRTHGRWRDISVERALQDFTAYMRGKVNAITYVDEDFVQIGTKEMDLLARLADEIILLKDTYRTQYYSVHKQNPKDTTFYAAMRVRSIYKKGDTAENKRKLERLRKLKEAGLIKVFLGVESGDPVQLSKDYVKGATVEENKRAIEILREEGIQVVVGFITFAPDSTLDQIVQNLLFMQNEKLIIGDPQTEAVNPFKMYRAQVEAPLTHKFNDLGFIASDKDPNTLMFDEVYRNPVVKMITDLGRQWHCIDEFEYYLKNIVWDSQHSTEAMEKASLFLNLFGALRNSSYELIEAFLTQLEDISINKEEKIESFLNKIIELPRDKMFFELKRAMFPHTDVYLQVEKYILKNQSEDSSFDIHKFLLRFLYNNFPDDFNFGSCNKQKYSRWVKEIKEDIAYQMLDDKEMDIIKQRFETVFKDFIETRLNILNEFRNSVWRIYFSSAPESAAVKNEIETALHKVIERHGALLKLDSYVDIKEEVEFNIYWKSALGEFVKYRHPAPAVPLGKLHEVLTKMIKEETYTDPSQAWIYRDGAIVIEGDIISQQELIEICGQILEQIFMSSFDPFNPLHQPLKEEFIWIYKTAQNGGFTNMLNFIQALAVLQRDFLFEEKIVIDETKIIFTPRAVDDKCIVCLGAETPEGGKVTGEMYFYAEGGNLPGVFKWNVPEQLIKFKQGQVIDVEDRFIDYFRQLLKTIMDENIELNGKKYNIESRYALMNALIASVNLFSEQAREQVLLAAEEILDDSILSQTIYLADTEQMHELAAEHRDIRFIFIHPVLYKRMWPGIESRLDEIIQFATPGLIDDFDRMLKKVNEGKLAPSFVRFIYEVFFNRVHPGIYNRNEDPEEVIKFTASALRYMPRKTPVFILNEQNPKVRKFLSPQDRVWQFIENSGGSLRFVVNPYVWRRWQKEGIAVPEDVEKVEWALTYPTASHRSLFLLGETAQKDLMAKTHSIIFAGPAMRRLKPGSVDHSHRISEALIDMIENARLPEEVRNRFSLLSEGGISFVDDTLYPGGIGILYRDQEAYPLAGEKRLLISEFALHNNDIRIKENPKKPQLIQVIEHNIKQTRQDPIDFFVDDILRPFYQIYFHLVFEEGILNDPHGQNSFLEVDLLGMLERFTFQDWQSTMVDLEQREKIGLHTEFLKHFIGEEASLTLSLSLVFDHYVGHYLLEQFVKVLVSEYHAKEPKGVFEAKLLYRMKQVFEEVMAKYSERMADFPDVYIRHGRKPKEDKSNRVYFRPNGPPFLRPSVFERTIFKAIDHGRDKGVLDIRWDVVVDEKAALEEDPNQLADMQLDLDQTRLFVDSEKGWQDIREYKGSLEGKNIYKLILPQDFDSEKDYPLLVALHHQGTSLFSLGNWPEVIDSKQAIIVVPNAPFEVKGRRVWFEEKDKNQIQQQKMVSEEYVLDIVQNVRDNFNVGNVHAAGISLGGYLALQLAVHHPEIFESLFLVNTPFKENYFNSADLERISGKKFPKVFFMHLVSDPVVRPVHSRRAETFLREKGVSVVRKLYPYGSHQKLSAAMGADMKKWLGFEKPDAKASGESDDTNIMIQETPVWQQYEILKERERTADIRLPQLTQLEQVINNLGTAQVKIDSTLRSISFLISMIASRGEVFSSEDRELLHIIVAVFPRTFYLLKQTLSERVERLDKNAAGQLLERINWIEKNISALEKKLVDVKVLDDRRVLKKTNWPFLKQSRELIEQAI